MLPRRRPIAGCGRAARIAFSAKRNGALWGIMRPKKVILCIDDNDQVLSVRKFVLETRGYRVLTANTAEQAIALYDDGKVDLVIADLVMPHCNGNDLIQRLKEIAPWVPAVLLSGSTKQFDSASRADAFLPKGASSPQELLERVRTLLVRKRGPKKSMHAHAPIQASA
jgi:two-component system response regulator CpxR